MINWTELDGVTTIWTDAPPPLRAGLLFRTGMVDETLVTSGQTHLIEHLALSTLPDPGQHNNGFVGGVVTGFLTLGTAEEVAGVLSGVCTALASLPRERLEGEKQVLAAEMAGQPYNFRARTLVWRYGARGYGLNGMSQLGLRGATIEQLQEISAQRFTRENTVLWLSGPPPDGLRLDLPHGMKQPIPPLTPIPPSFPSWYVDDLCGGVAVSAIVPRVTAATLFCDIAHRRLRERLRTEKALSYGPNVFYDPLNAEVAHLILYADSHPDHRLELAGEFGPVYEELCEISAEEVETARQQAIEHWTGSLAPPPADRMLIETQRAAMEWIFGREPETLEALADEAKTVTTGDVARFVQDLRKTALVALPSGVSLQPWMGAETPVSNSEAVHGRVVSCIDAPINTERLVHGPDGVTVRLPNGTPLTVRYAELAAALAFEDGGLQLIGTDAAAVVVEPTLWRHGKKIVRSIREHVPAHLLVELGARPAEAIPKPKTTLWQRLYAQLVKP